MREKLVYNKEDLSKKHRFGHNHSFVEKSYHSIAVNVNKMFKQSWREKARLDGVECL